MGCHEETTNNTETNVTTTTTNYLKSQVPKLRERQIHLRQYTMSKAFFSILRSADVISVIQMTTKLVA